MNAAAWKAAGVVGLLLLLVTGCAVWKIQDWRHHRRRRPGNDRRAGLSSLHQRVNILTDQVSCKRDTLVYGRPHASLIRRGP